MLKPTQIATFGGPADVCLHHQRVVAAWQSGKDTDVHLVIAEFDPITHARLVSVSLPLGNDVGAFPRLLSALDAVWCIYREGASKGGRAVLLRDGREVWRSTVECGGNDPVCLGGEWFAWQRFGSNVVEVASLLQPTTVVATFSGSPTGLSHIVYAGTLLGTVARVDDVRGSVPGMTRPSGAGELVAGEHPDSGVLIRSNGGSELRIWPGEETVTPRLAHDASTGTYAVVTSGVRNGIDYGVRLATFTASELVAPVEPDAPWPPGKGWTRRDDIAQIPILPFMIGGPAGFSRDGAHVPIDGVALYSHWMQSRYLSADAAQVTKPNGHTTFTFDTIDWTIGIAYDGTNEIDGGYRILVPRSDRTAPIWNANMRVGETHRIETPVEILTLKTGARGAVTCRTWVDAVYDGPAVGNVPAGRHALLGYTFDIIGDGIDGDPRGVVEYTLCRENHGQVAWFEFHRRLGTWRRWFGVRNVARQPDPTPLFADEIPAPVVVVRPPVPDPEPPPMPPTQPTLPPYAALVGWRGYLSARDEQDATRPWAPHDADLPDAQWVANMAVWAMPDLRGWERWRITVVSTSPLRVAFRSVWGHHLCAEFGGNDKVVQRQTATPGAYEVFDAESLGAGWWAFRTADGWYLTMEADGTLTTTRNAIEGSWQTWKLEPVPSFVLPGEQLPTVPVPPPPTGGGPSGTAGRLRKIGRSLADDQGERLLLNTSMFQATTLLEHELALYRDNLVASQEAKIDEWRMGAAINWPDGIQDETPNEARHIEKIVTCIDEQWGAGIRTDLCLFLAQSDIPEISTLSMCEDYTRRVCRALKDRQFAFRMTVANEPGDTRVWRLGLEGLRRIRDVIRQELPDVLIGLGAPWHPRSLGTCEWTEGSREDGENALPWFAVGCQTVGPHYGRSTLRRRNARQPWLGRRDSGGTDAVMVDEEPIGAFNYYRPDGSLFNQNEQDPVNLGVYATASWMQGHAVYCWHTGAGIGYQRLSRSPAYFGLREMPGLYHVAAAKAVLPGDLASFQFANWGWSLAQGQWFTRDYEPNDTDGTPATRGHCATAGGRFVLHEFFADRAYTLTPRVGVEFAMWDRVDTTFVQVAQHRLRAGESLRLQPCADRLLIGRHT